MSYVIFNKRLDLNGKTIFEVGRPYNILDEDDDYYYISYMDKSHPRQCCQFPKDCDDMMVFPAGYRHGSKANENSSLYNDKELFVHNLGVLLSQTRENIKGCELVDFDTVMVLYRDTDYTLSVNITADSYTAIVYDVTKRIMYD